MKNGETIIFELNDSVVHLNNPSPTFSQYLFEINYFVSNVDVKLAKLPIVQLFNCSGLD